MNPRQTKMEEFQAFSEAMKNLQPPLDINEVLKLQTMETMGQQAQQVPPPEALPYLMQAFQGDPSQLSQTIPWWPKQEKQAGPPMGEELMKLIQGGPALKERRNVRDDSGRQAQALVDENGSIVGFAEPGTDNMMEDFSPSADSVGGFPAFKYWLANAMKDTFNFNQPTFNQPAIPVQKGN